MQSIRTAVYFLVLITSLILIILFCWWVLFLPSKYVRKFGGYWDGFAVWSLGAICGTKTVIKGRENILGTSAIYASKHQSALETFVLGYEVLDSAFTLKKSLYYIPIFGWFLARAGMVGIDRSRGSESIKKMLARSREVRDEGKSFVLFPEGTRRAVDAEPDYKSGVYMIYKELGIPVVPVAHNTGVFWKQGQFAKESGTVTVSFLPPIEAGLNKKEFMQRLVNDIETETNKLVAV